MGYNNLNFSFSSYCITSHRIAQGYNPVLGILRHYVALKNTPLHLVTAAKRRSIVAMGAAECEALIIYFPADLADRRRGLWQSVVSAGDKIRWPFVGYNNLNFSFSSYCITSHRIVSHRIAQGYTQCLEYYATTWLKNHTPLYLVIAAKLIGAEVCGNRWYLREIEYYGHLWDTTI